MKYSFDNFDGVGETFAEQIFFFQDSPINSETEMVQMGRQAKIEQNVKGSSLHNPIIVNPAGSRIVQ